MSTSTKDKMLEAQQLIKAKQYEEARRILVNIDHPKAAEWLAKIGATSSTDETNNLSTLIRNESRPSPKDGNVPVWAVAVAACIAFLFVGFIGGYLIGSSRPAPAAEIATMPTLVDASANDTEATPEPAKPTNTPIVLLSNPQTGTTPEPAEDECRNWLDEVNPIITTFFDIGETASQTARMSLSSVVLEMRQTQREFERVETPECMRDIRRKISSGMASAVSGFNSFLGNSDFLSLIDLSLANQYFHESYYQLLAIPMGTDYRMANTSIFIWGGDEGVDPTPEPGT